MNRRLLLATVFGAALAGCSRQPPEVPTVVQPVLVVNAPAEVLPPPRPFDWSKATDDERFALLKPVMTYEEVERLKIGKEPEGEGCGSAHDDRGYVAPSVVAGYSYVLTGRAEPVEIRFTLHGKFQSPGDLSKPRPETQASGWGWGQQSPPATQSKWTLVAFRADRVLYRRNKDGVYVAQK